MALHRLPRTGPVFEGATDSLLAVRSIFRKKFIVRDEPANDFGVDGLIELLRYDASINDHYVTNLRAYFQLKHTSSPKVLSDGSISYPIETQNLAYLNSQLRSLYLLYDTTSDKLYMRWHHHIIGELSRSNPQWIKQDTVNIRFSQVVTEDCLIEIEGEITAHAEQVLQLRDGPGLVRNFSSHRLPDLLRPHEPFVGRTSEHTMLVARLTPGSIIPVLGISESGKTEFVAHLLSDEATLDQVTKKFSLPPALLFINLGAHISNRRVLRGLAYALGVNKIGVLEAVDWDELASTPHAKAILLGQILPSRLQQQSVIAVFENSQEVLDDESSRADLDQILACDNFRDGASIIIAHHGPVPNGSEKRLLRAAVRLENLPPKDAEELLAKIVNNPSIAASVIREVEGIPELLIPGTIIRGAADFERRVIDDNLEPTLSILLDAIFNATSHIIRHTLSSFGCDEITRPDGSPGSLATLLTIGIFADIDVSDDLLLAAQLPPPPFQMLLEARWVTRSAGGYRLTGIARHGLRNEAQLILKGERSATMKPELIRSIDRFLKAIDQTGDAREGERHARAIEEAIAWMKSVAPSATAVLDRLLEALLPYTVDDRVFPLTEHESTELRERIQTSGHPDNFNSIVAELVAITRFAVDTDYVLSRLRQAVRLAQIVPDLTAQHLRALDISIYIFGRRLRLREQFLDIRLELTPKILDTARGLVAPDIGQLKWSISWLLHTGTLALSTGQLSQVRQLPGQITELLEMLPVPTRLYGVVDWNWLWSRLRGLEARVANDWATRIGKLREAASYALNALIASGKQERMLTFYLRSARRLIEELNTDKSRTEAIEAVLEQLTSIYGATTQWPLHVRCLAGALIRDTANLYEDLAQQEHNAQKAVEMLALFKEELIATAELGDTRGLLVLARAYVFWATCQYRLGIFHNSNIALKEAQGLCNIALKAFPSTAAWDLTLSLQEQEDVGPFEGGFNQDPLVMLRKEISPKLGKLIKGFRSWVKDSFSRGAPEGRVTLWCLQREWGVQGGIESRAAESIAAAQDWTVMNPTKKKEVITNVYKDRQKSLVAIEKRFGKFLDLYLTRASLEAQYQRLLGVYGNHKLDLSSIAKIYSEAAIIWPYNQDLQENKARLNRNLWNFADAIEGYRRVRELATDGDQRRRVTVSLVEALLTAAINATKLEFSDGSVSESAMLITEARTVLMDLLGFRNVATEVATLRDRVEYEAGGDVDWDSIDDAYHLVVGGIDNYLETVVRNLDEILGEKPELPDTLAEAVRQNATTSGVLRGMGSLYLRRAEKQQGPDPLSDCYRAYAIFNACRILEKSRLGAESPKTGYQRAKAILAGASIASAPDPFPVYKGKRATALDLSLSLLQSSASKSVDPFYSEVRRREAEVTSLRRLLTNTTS